MLMHVNSSLQCMCSFACRVKRYDVAQGRALDRELLTDG